jgi:hypothetical protein
LQPDLAAEGDRGIDVRVGMEKRIKCRDEPPDPITVEREARRHAHQAIGARAAPERFGEQRPEVPEIARCDRSLLVGKRREVDAVSASSQVGALANCDIVAVFTQLSGDLGGEVLVEQELQAENASVGFKSSDPSFEAYGWQVAITRQAREWDLAHRAQQFTAKVVAGSPGTVVYTTTVELNGPRRR